MLFGDRKSSPKFCWLLSTLCMYVCERINGTVYSDKIGQHWTFNHSTFYSAVNRIFTSWQLLDVKSCNRNLPTQTSEPVIHEAAVHKKSTSTRKGARVLSDGTAIKDHGVITVTTSVSEDCQGVFLIFFFFKSSSWKQLLNISSPFSWVAKLQLVERMTPNICSTSAEDASISQLHHIQSPSYFVKVVLIVYVTNRQVWTTSCYSE